MASEDEWQYAEELPCEGSELCAYEDTDHAMELARSVIEEDDVVDSYNRSVIEQLIKAMHESDEAIESCLLLISVSRQLERIGDHATNIAEDVVYLAQGEIVRHSRFGGGAVDLEREPGLSHR